jgi:hypothetical protein
MYFVSLVSMASSLTSAPLHCALQGSLVVTAGQRTIAEFEDHWVRIDANNPSAENPWYQEGYMDKYQ